MNRQVNEEMPVVQQLLQMAERTGSHVYVGNKKDRTRSGQRSQQSGEVSVYLLSHPGQTSFKLIAAGLLYSLRNLSENCTAEVFWVKSETFSRI